MMNDEAIVQQVLASFGRTLDGQITAIRDALATGEDNAVFQAAHSLKGTASNVGAEPLHDACAALEHAAKNNQSAIFSSLFTEVELAATRLRTVLPA
jgi:HPt (histidine-containing phosphotransfer) domain-containing protein